MSVVGSGVGLPLAAPTYWRMAKFVKLEKSLFSGKARVPDIESDNRNFYRN